MEETKERWWRMIEFMAGAHEEPQVVTLTDQCYGPLTQSKC